MAFRDADALSDDLGASVSSNPPVVRRHLDWNCKKRPEPLPAEMTSKPCPYTIDGRWTLKDLTDGR